MCEPASFVVWQDKVGWSKIGDSHYRIRQELGIGHRYDGVLDFDREGVPVEICPRPKSLAGRDYSLPLDQWGFYVDVDPEIALPDWWDAADAEARCREALSEWANYHIVRNRFRYEMLALLGESSQEAATLIALDESEVVDQRGGQVWLYHRSRAIHQHDGRCFLWHQAVSAEQQGGESFLCGQSEARDQRGGVCQIYEQAVSRNPTGGVCNVYGPRGSVVEQIGGLVSLVSEGMATGQIGGICYARGASKVVGQRGGICQLFGFATAEGQKGGECIDERRKEKP